MAVILAAFVVYLALTGRLELYARIGGFLETPDPPDNTLNIP